VRLRLVGPCGTASARRDDHRRSGLPAGSRTRGIQVLLPGRATGGRSALVRRWKNAADGMVRRALFDGLPPTTASKHLPVHVPDARYPRLALAPSASRCLLRNVLERRRNSRCSGRRLPRPGDLADHRGGNVLLMPWRRLRQRLRDAGHRPALVAARFASTRPPAPCCVHRPAACWVTAAAIAVRRMPLLECAIGVTAAAAESRPSTRLGAREHVEGRISNRPDTICAAA